MRGRFCLMVLSGLLILPWRLIAGDAPPDMQPVDPLPAAFPLPVQVGVMAFAPFFELDENQDPPTTKGLLMPVLSALMAEARLPYHITLYPPPRLYRNLIGGQSQMTLSIAAVPEIADYMLPLDTPVAAMKLNIYWLADTLAPPTNPQPAWWSDKSVCRVRGFSYAGVVRQLNQLQPPPLWNIAKDPLQAERLLDGKRCAYLLEYQYPGAPMADEAHRAGQPTTQHQTLREVEWQVMVSANGPNAVALLDRLRQAQQRLQARGMLQRLLPHNHPQQGDAYPPMMPDGRIPH